MPYSSIEALPYPDKKGTCCFFRSKREHDQVMPQSQTTDQPTAPRGRDTEQDQPHNIMVACYGSIVYDKWVMVLRHTGGTGVVVRRNLDSESQMLGKISNVIHSKGIL